MPSFEHELKLGYPHARIAGVDEVGRGCIAGPVVAACVVLPDFTGVASGHWIESVNDSKLLTPKKREDLSLLIREQALCFCLSPKRAYQKSIPLIFSTQAFWP